MPGPALGPGKKRSSRAVFLTLRTSLNLGRWTSKSITRVGYVLWHVIRKAQDNTLRKQVREDFLEVMPELGFKG